MDVVYTHPSSAKSAESASSMYVLYQTSVDFNPSIEAETQC